MPTATKLTTSDEPPALTNGSVIPVTGMSETTTPMLMNAWTHSHVVMPVASSAPKVSGAATAIRIPRYARSANSPMTTTAPMSPNSSPTTAKT